jgi:uncharacterized protein YdeI (YjbR/CyaY-like superfamily)
MEITNLLEFTDRGQLRKWLEENHASERQCWVDQISSMSTCSLGT